MADKHTALDRIIEIGQNDTVDKLSPTELILYTAWIQGGYVKTDELERAAAELVDLHLQLAHYEIGADQVIAEEKEQSAEIERLEEEVKALQAIVRELVKVRDEQQREIWAAKAAKLEEK